MPTIEVPMSKFAEFVQREIEAYCNDDRYVDPVRVQALLQEHSEVNASLDEVADALFYLKSRGILKIEIFGNPRGVYFQIVR